MQEFFGGIDPENLSFSGLTIPKFTKEATEAAYARVEAEKAAYHDMYGDAWEKPYWDHVNGIEPDCDMRVKCLNIDVFYTGECHPQCGSLSEREAEKAAFDAYLHEVYGDAYEELKATRVDMDPRVGELLITRALMTGRWKELPDELQSEYHKRKEVLA